ncbi:MAG: isoprenylcysteine carboxylmethyltransferase family protein [Sphingomonadaceae bacterium]|nr:isoprenylcysteine carboxylmethyltransferase family protein [Sphingomonadaceae bacterium]
MTKPVFAAYAIAAYAVFLATFLYLVAFVAGWPIVPHTVDHGPAAPLAGALAIDAALIALFGVQHSIMARQGFKRGWARIVPAPIERSTYMLFACAALILMFLLWRPISTPIWHVEARWATVLIWALFAAGWLIVLLSTFLINHFELFGLQQVYHHWRGVAAAAPKLRQPLFYRLVRHPLYSGFFLAFWATPAMTGGHLLLALGLSAYMLIAIRYEERDLVRLFGTDYEDYRRRVGMLTPRRAR